MAKTHSRWFLKAWRKHRGLTLEKLAERVSLSAGYLSDLEKGKRRYNQDHLETLAEALRCDPADLIMRDPTAPDSFWSLWERVAAEDREQATRVLEAFVKKTGTDN